MRTPIPSILVIPLIFGLAPVAALADEHPTCGDYVAELSDEQRAFLEGQSIVLEVPEGTVEIIQRCDIDDNNMVDINDIRLISLNRNRPASDPDDPMDWDRNGQIDLLDVRGCQRACAFPRCAVQSIEPEELMGGVTAPAECFQKDDFDGDGEQDFVAVTEDTSGTEADGYNLEVTILSKENNQVQLVKYPYTGQKASETGGEIKQHLSRQMPGTVDLNPGTLKINDPAIVSYRDGKPHVIYYFVNGKVQRAFYGIDD